MSRQPLICTITQDGEQGGIARVAQLLNRAVAEFTQGQYRSIALFPDALKELGTAERLRFAAAVTAAQLMQPPSWILFDHLGLARAQNLVPAFRRVPFAIFLHSVEVWGPLSADRERVLKGARVRLANSHYTARRVLATHPAAAPLQVCHLALLPEREAQRLNPASRDEIQHPLLEKIRPHAVLIVGRMLSTERHKGHDQLLQVWQQVLARVPDAQLVIVGQGDDVSRLTAQAEGLGIAPSVIFSGHLKDNVLEAVYARAAVYAMPAQGEGFGLVFLEAMSHRLPCIASSEDASAEIVQDGETGFLVKQSDGAAIADRIVRLLDDAELRRRMGAAGFARWQEHFSYRQFAERLKNFLAPLTDERVGFQTN